MKPHGIAISAAALLLAATAQAGPTQFSLSCSGTENVGVYPTPKPFQQTYQVDLTARKYCDTPHCGSIAEVTPDIIYFEHAEQPTTEWRRADHFVRRTDGKLMNYHLGRDGLIIMREGQCQIGPFGGFPKTPF